ncbi:sensor histidine kinase [Lacisediminihabitans changchengi]|uniref:histidine kinase n=1 Tax=Lacisediminihabitans changchengi TaxID=2787634 RepID=A0A934SJV8_9MICO|nr:HAMP domain-containing sensor histidine kinase [Lacisediminihabitans changchengi]MBK4346901.1 HAMP domain-containing histidine kinase [Lacisediminihabitans changchengi]MBK4347976.1 HAMP domain-containing histidine kinase [Lacisediminihabitans changchengi]
MMLLRRLSIRWRITLGSSFIAALIFAGAGLGFRVQLESILSSTTTTVLAHDAAPFVSQIQNDPTAIDRPGKGQLVSVINADGTAVVSSLPRPIAARLSSIVAIPADSDGDVVRSISDGDDVYRVRVQTVAESGGDWHVVTVRNEDSSMLLLGRATTAIVIGAIALLIGFGVASWLLTGAALRPVTRMRQQAQALAAEGSTEPLPVGPARDELSALATTLNEFITDIRGAVDRERQLVWDASHELRTPIAILSGQLELAHLSSGDASALEAEISAAELSVARLSALATGLLELSQLEQPENGAERATSDWTALGVELAASVDRARMLVAATGVTIDYDIAAVDTADRYRIDPVNVGRLIDNLANNAVAALGSEGSVRIALRHSAVGLVLTVVDSGPGMPEDFIPIAFDRFSRPDRSRTTTRGGAGLGLAIVHAIVTGAGGTISLANADGLSVTVTLPRVPTT